MPTYEYKCDNCGYQWEQFQSMTAAPIKRCPSCGKSKARRLIGIGAGVIFKGSGFYETDYRDSSYKEKAKAEAGGGSTADASKPAAESKPAAAESSPAKTESAPAKKESNPAKKSKKPE
jgi:putative FmdB family regulatory protein